MRVVLRPKNWFKRTFPENEDCDGLVRAMLYPSLQVKSCARRAHLEGCDSQEVQR
jgi:hypothetical protein